MPRECNKLKPRGYYKNFSTTAEAQAKVNAKLSHKGVLHLHGDNNPSLTSVHNNKLQTTQEIKPFEGEEQTQALIDLIPHIVE